MAAHRSERWIFQDGKKLNPLSGQWVEPIDVAEFRSRSDPGKKPYLATAWADGTYSCTCRGWTILRPNKHVWERACKHTRLMELGIVGAHVPSVAQPAWVPPPSPSTPSAKIVVRRIYLD